MAATGAGSGAIGPPALSRRGIDRAAHRRSDEAYLAAAWAAPQSRAFLLHDGRALIDFRGKAPRLVLREPRSLPGGERMFLGESAGTAYFAVHASPPAEPPAGCAVLGLREVGALLGAADAGLLTHAVALANWHASAGFCPRCGAATVSSGGGSVRRCGADGSVHFPRVDPAVIMLVHDGADRVVLGRAPSWPVGRFSILAGFVEPGEPLEHAVAREVAEEVGLTVRDIRYVASQPWPLPSSLMLGFTARAAYQELAPDIEELAEAYWFTRDDVREGRAGIPSASSIAHWLLQRWLRGIDTDKRGIAVSR